VWYFYRKDIYDPEPKHLIVRDFLWGMFIVFPVSLLEAPFGEYLKPETPLITLFLATILIVGLFEEGAKSLIVYLFHYYHPEFNEPLDGIIYGVTVGLGFAAFENVFYTVLYGYQVGLTRAVITSLVHASFTGIFGYFVGQAKIRNNKSLIITGFVLVTIFHGLYDFLLISNMIGLFSTVLIVIILHILLIHLISVTLENSPFK